MSSKNVSRFSFSLPVSWLFVLLCLASSSYWVFMVGHWPLASPSSCPATSHQCLPWAAASQKPVEPGTCGAQSLLIQSKAGAARRKDQRTGTPWWVMCPQALCPGNIDPAWVTYSLSSGGIGDDLFDRISWSGEWTVTPRMGCWQQNVVAFPLYLLTKYKCLMGQQLLAGLSISSLPLNKPVRSLSEQGLNGWVRKARNFLVPLKLRSKDRDSRSWSVILLKKKISGKEDSEYCRTGFHDITWGQRSLFLIYCVWQQYPYILLGCGRTCRFFREQPS